MQKNHIYLIIIAGLLMVLGYQVWSFSGRSDGALGTGNGKQIVMYKNPGCQCCHRWAGYMKGAGFDVVEKPTDRLAAINSEHGISYTMQSCHTALIDGYVVEGHVPVREVQRLLKEHPDAKGLAVPGMPQGSPGMETGQKESYTVYLMHNDGSKSVYAQY